MSHYCEYVGELVFPDLKTFEKAAEDVKGWISLEGHGDGCVGVSSYDLIIDMDKKVIRIPPRNLDQNVRGWLVGVSDDGCFEGSSFADGKWVYNDLREKYHEEHQKRPHPVGTDTEECQGSCDACSEFDTDIQDAYLDENRKEFSVDGMYNNDLLVF